jgi:hypothetical protein
MHIINIDAKTGAIIWIFIKFTEFHVLTLKKFKMNLATLLGGILHVLV